MNVIYIVAKLVEWKLGLERQEINYVRTPIVLEARAQHVGRRMVTRLSRRCDVARLRGKARANWGTHANRSYEFGSTIVFGFF